MSGRVASEKATQRERTARFSGGPSDRVVGRPAVPVTSATRQRSAASTACRKITVAGRTLRPSPVFDTYWRFAALRQDLYFARQERPTGPWTADPIMMRHRFTNAYRAADRATQHLIRHVQYDTGRSATDVVFRTLLFKFFNKIETWELLSDELGQPLTWDSYDFMTFDSILESRRRSGERLYSAAYVVPPPALGERYKHQNHLRLIELMMRDRLPDRLAEARGLADVFGQLRAYPSVGDFLAYQWAIDLNYSTAISFSEMEFVVAGPGAQDGIEKCFGPEARGIEPEVIRWMADHQDEQFDRLGLAFRTLWGRPLQLIDIQNLFCEVDKYARVAHADIAGRSGRSRIKQSFTPAGHLPPPWFPPRWGLNAMLPVHAAPPAPSESHQQLALA